VFSLFGIAVANREPEATDPMNTPPPAHLADEQLAEFRALMGGANPPNPAND